MRSRCLKGAEISLRLGLPRKSPLDVTGTLEQVEPGRLLTWRGHVVVPWIFGGQQRNNKSLYKKDRVLMS